jgi:hypothetical protein
LNSAIIVSSVAASAAKALSEQLFDFIELFFCRALTLFSLHTVNAPVTIRLTAPAQNKDGAANSARGEHFFIQSPKVTLIVAGFNKRSLV